jgi:hypothetical protein
MKCALASGGISKELYKSQVVDDCAGKPERRAHSFPVVTGLVIKRYRLRTTYFG